VTVVGGGPVTTLEALLGPDTGRDDRVRAVAVPSWAAHTAAGDRTARALELPAADDPLVPIEDALGGRAAAWSAGYRDGREEGLIAGHAEGFDLGRADGAAATRAEATERFDVLAAAVADALASEHRRLDELADEVAELAVELATTVVGHHVAAVEDPGAEALRRAVAAAPVGRSMLARLHPEDVAALRVDTALLAPGRPLEVVADPAVARGDCVLEAGPTVVDATFGAALARVRDALRSDDPGTDGP
jgi:flagellar assembly protein FliH